MSLFQRDQIDAARRRFWLKVDQSAGSAGCWPWTGNMHEGGYGVFHVAKVHGTDHVTGAHRAAWELERGPIPDGLHVLHRCDNRPCVNPTHLFLGTNADNIADREAKGRGKRVCGEAHPRAKLTRAAADEIRGSVESMGSLARRFGVSREVVKRIKRGTAWKAS